MKQMYKLDKEMERQKEMLFSSLGSKREKEVVEEQQDKEEDSRIYKIELLESHLEEQIMRNEKQSLMIKYLKSNNWEQQIELHKQQIDSLNQKLAEQKVLLTNMNEEYGRLCDQTQEQQQQIQEQQQQIQDEQKRYKGLKQQYKMLFIGYEKQQECNRSSQQSKDEDGQQQYKCKYEQLLGWVRKVVDVDDSDNVEQMIQCLEQWSAELMGQLEQYQVEVDQQQGIIGQQQNQIVGLQQTVDQCQSEVDQIQQKYQEQQEINVQVKQQQQYIEQLRKEIQQLKVSSDGIQQQLENRNSNIEQLNGQLEIQDGDIKQLKQQLEIKDSSIEQLKEQVKNRKSDNDGLMEQIKEIRQYRSESYEQKETELQKYWSEQQQSKDKEKRISESNKYIISFMQHAIKEREVISADCQIKQQNQIVRLANKLVERLSQKQVILKSEIEQNKWLKDKIRNQQINSQKQDEQFQLMKNIMKTMIQQMNGKGRQEIKNYILSSKQKNKENIDSNTKKYVNVFNTVKPFSDKKEVLIVSESSFYKDQCELDSRDLLGSLIEGENDFWSFGQ